MSVTLTFFAGIRKHASRKLWVCHRELPFGIALSRLLFRNEQTRGVHEQDDFRVLLISPSWYRCLSVQKEITALADVICFRGGDSNKEKKSPSLRTRVFLRTERAAGLLLVRHKEKNNHGVYRRRMPVENIVRRGTVTRN